MKPTDKLTADPKIAAQEAADLLRELYSVFSDPRFTDRHGYANEIKRVIHLLRDSGLAQ